MTVQKIQITETGRKVHGNKLIILNTYYVSGSGGFLWFCFKKNTFTRIDSFNLRNALAVGCYYNASVTDEEMETQRC